MTDHDVTDHDVTDRGVSATRTITAREVPLGGLRAMTVRRTLPARQRAFVGAWCFVDHYGPDEVSLTGGMDVPPHPHTGLATVTWLFTGTVEHRDSHGVHAIVRPGEINLMSAGAGICHSEVSTPQTRLLHGVQLWLVLPAGHAHGERDFQHHAPQPQHPADGVTVMVFIGSLPGLPERSASPIRTATPLLGAQIDLAPGTSWRLAVRPDFEHAVLADTDGVIVDGEHLDRGDLAVRDTGANTLTISNPGTDSARCVLLGGEPFTEEVIMWWNFIGRSQGEIEEFRRQWQDGAGGESSRFGHVEGYAGEKSWIPAPDLPMVTLRPRGRLGRR